MNQFTHRYKAHTHFINAACNAGLATVAGLGGAALHADGASPVFAIAGAAFLAGGSVVQFHKGMQRLKKANWRDLYASLHGRPVPEFDKDVLDEFLDKVEKDMQPKVPFWQRVAVAVDDYNHRQHLKDMGPDLVALGKVLREAESTPLPKPDGRYLAKDLT